MANENDILSDYLQSLYGIEPLTIQEEHALAAKIQQGDEDALDKLVTHNLRFVVHVVRNMTAWQHGKVPPTDMISMGNEALINAAKGWVPTNNARFATYAKPFIAMGVRRDLDNTANMIRLPINVMEELKRLNYYTRNLTQILGREPKIDELAKITKLSADRIRQLRHYVNREPVSLNNLKNERQVEETNDD